MPEHHGSDYEPVSNDITYDSAKTRLWEITAAYWRGEMSDEEKVQLRSESMQYLEQLKEAFNSGRIDGEDENLLKIWVIKEVIPVLEKFENGISYAEALDTLDEATRKKLPLDLQEGYVPKSQRPQRPKSVEDELRELFNIPRVGKE